jgi:colicin import membrane protein
MSTQIQEYSATEAALATLAERYKGVVYDVTTKEGMAAAKAGRNEIRGYRTALEAKRVEIKAPALERCRLIDSEAKRITAALEDLEGPIAAQIKKEEDRIAAEKAAKEEALRKRTEEIMNRLQAMRELPVKAFSATSEQMQEFITALESQEINEETFGDFQSDAENLREATLATLKLNLNTKLQQEAEAKRLAEERAELERKQAEQAARDAEAARLREEAERESRRKIEEEERAARLRIEEEQRAARAAQEEQERKERAEREAKEAAERAARLAEEERQREIQRKENQKLDGREMLVAFVDQYGEVEEFGEVVAAITKYLDGLKKAA